MHSIEGGRALEHWRSAKEGLALADFEGRYPHVFLVWLVAPGARGAVVQGVSSPNSLRVDFHTQMERSSAGLVVQPAPSTPSRPPPVVSRAENLKQLMNTQPLDQVILPPTHAETCVLPIVKATSNPFPDRVSVGRAPNCDIVIRDPSVSKLHGHFRDVTANSTVFTDARSSNGTRINGSAAKPAVQVPVKSLDHIVLGRVRLQLMSPSDLYNWL